MMKRIQIFALGTLMALAPVFAQAEQVDENPSGATMMADLLVARPIGLVVFAVSSATFVATLPFSLAGGNAADAGKALVVEPGKEVFVRCLGCRKPGRKEKLKD